MAHQITAVHMSPPSANDHEHISDVRWWNDQSGETGETDRANMVTFIRGGNYVYVRDQYGTVRVVVVEASPPYIRTEKDGRKTDNLLSLPRF